MQLKRRVVAEPKGFGYPPFLFATATAQMEKRGKQPFAKKV